MQSVSIKNHRREFKFVFAAYFSFPWTVFGCVFHSRNFTEEESSRFLWQWKVFYRDKKPNRLPTAERPEL